MTQKTTYIRDKRLRSMCQQMPCQHCGSLAGSTWAHSNQSRHGKGRSIKSSDIYVAALCGECHMEVDQGRGSRAERLAMWEDAHARTVAEAQRLGLWPAGVPVPNARLTGAHDET